MNRIDLWALGCSILRGQGREGYKLSIQILESNQASGAGFSKAPWHRGRGLEVKGKETMSQGPWSVACDQGLWLKHSAPWPLQFLFSDGKSVRTLCIRMSGATAASWLSDLGMSTALNKDKWHLWSQFLHYKRKKEDNTPLPNTHTQSKELWRELRNEMDESPGSWINGRSSSRRSSCGQACWWLQGYWSFKGNEWPLLWSKWQIVRYWTSAVAGRSQ